MEVLRAILLLPALVTLGLSDKPNHFLTSYSPNHFKVSPKYDFEYGVQDTNYGPNFGAQEDRNGYRTSGSYYVDLPDGRRQNVKYHVTKESGYVADISYEPSGAKLVYASNKKFTPVINYVTANPSYLISNSLYGYSVPILTQVAPFVVKRYSAHSSSDSGEKFIDTKHQNQKEDDLSSSPEMLKFSAAPQQEVPAPHPLVVSKETDMKKKPISQEADHGPVTLYHDFPVEQRTHSLGGYIVSGHSFSRRRDTYSKNIPTVVSYYTAFPVPTNLREIDQYKVDAAEYL